MDSDWDLHAVVRGCSSTTTSFPLNPLGQQKSTFHGENNTNNNLMGFSFFFPDLFQPRNDDNSIEQFLNDLYNNPLRFQKVQNTPPCSPSLPISPLSVLGGLLQQEKKKELQGKEQPFGVTRCTTSHAQSTTKLKKRKNQMKKVCQVPAEGTPPDLWSWRKYGQKPIKGSPYPRGYYRCSTSKGCSARKQVERNRSDPGMLILTYTGDHNHPMPTHRNSLAGSSRNKPTVSGDDDTITNKPTSSSPVSPATSLSPATENTEENENRNRPTSSSPVSLATENSEENENRNKPTSSSPVSPATENERDDTDDDNNFAVSGDVMDEDFFDGLDELVGSVTGDSFSDHLPASPEGVDFWRL